MNKIVIFGGSGFIGTNLLLKLSKNKRLEIHATYFSKKNFYKIKGVKYHKVDLSKSSSKKIISNLLKNSHSVFMLAAISSGAKIIENDPISQFTPNLKFNLEIIDQCYKYNVKKFIFISSNTVYPVSNFSMKENDVNYSFFEKYYMVGWMKLFTEIICNVYVNKIKNSNLEILVVRPSNLYGPYDKFSREKSKVIAALIRKFNDKSLPIEIWGDGNDIKDFLYINDFCDALLHVYKNFKGLEIMNICSGKSIKLKTIINYLTKYFGLTKADLKYNINMPSMIPLRKMSGQKLKNKYNYKINYDVNSSLNKTIKWYQKNKSVYDNF